VSISTHVAVGVGHICTATANDDTESRPIPFRIAMYASGERFVSSATGVGHNEDPPPKMRGTDGRCGYTIPFRIEPDLGQVPENSPESQGKVPWDILQQRPSRS
jgi:hypothetical protein